MSEMTLDEANTKAIQRIDAAKASGQWWLDLGDLPIEAVPKDIERLSDQVRVLALGKLELKIEGDEPDWEYRHDRPGSVSDVSALASLTNLTTLDLSGCEQVSDVTAVASLTNLTTLNLRWCSLMSDVSALASLTNLTALDLSGCEQVSDVTALASLTNLTTLNLQYCRAKSFARLDRLPQLQELHVYGSRFPDLHPAVCGKGYRDNALASVRQYFAALGPDAEPDAEVKVFVLGNGRAGKTKLVGRLRGLPFDAIPEGSTHGVQLWSEPWTDGELPHDVRLNFWDFGGQDIYHGTHALFLRGPAIYIVLYASHLENDNEDQEGGIDLKNHRLQYWFDYLLEEVGGGSAEKRAVKSPVLLIQSQCDEESQEDDRPPASPSQEQFPQLRKRMHLSAKNPNRQWTVDRVRSTLTEAVKELLDEHPQPPLPKTWTDVRHAIRQMQQQQQPATMTQEEFADLCEQHGCRENAEVLRDALHLMGVVFYRQGIFENRIVINQQWILNKVYTIFNRQMQPFQDVLKDKNGQFRRSDLQQHFWQTESPGEQRMYLSFMEQCGICFKTDEYKYGDYEGRYIAPDLLPRWGTGPEKEFGWNRSKIDAGVSANFHLLHDGIARNFLAKIGQRAGGRADYWRYGCRFKDATTQSEALIYTKGNTIRMEARDEARNGRSAELVQTLVEILKNAASGREPEIVWDESVAQPVIVERTRDMKPEERLQPVRVPTVFISYAWAICDADIDDLEQQLNAWGWKVRRDKTEMKTGDSISRFMANATGSDRIVIVLSEKYLESIYCMKEIHTVYMRSGEDEDAFRGVIAPITLPSATIFTDEQRGVWARYWRKKHDDLKPLVAEGNISKKGLERWKAMEKWALDVPDILEYIADTLHPTSFEAAKANNWAMLKDKLDRGEA